MAITFRRTLHPVGQGAFFTEQFLDEGSQKSFYNVVYDCGSISRNHNYIIRKAVDDVFDKNSHIDLLFISHFDEDHINGIQFMIDERSHLIDKETTVFIPFKYAQALSALEGQGAYDSIGILVRKMMAIDVHIIGVDDDMDFIDNQTTLDRDSISLDSLKYRYTIPNGAKLRYDCNDIHWHYVPFVMKRNRSNYLDKFKIEFQRLGGNLNDLLDKDYIRCHFDIIRDAARNAGTGNEINMHSLQLLSFFPRQSNKLNANGLNGQYDYITNMCKDKNINASILSSCLYTGDANLRSVYYYAYEMFFVREILEKFTYDCQLGMMQIPHHGSKLNYPVYLANDSLVYSAFVNYDSNCRHAHFNTEICSRFYAIHKLLFKVMESSNSEYFATLLLV